MKAILYVVDALRADHLSCYGYDRQTSDRIDELSEDAVVFTNAQSQSTWTRASAGALLTGLYPNASGIETIHDDLPDGVPYLPSVLSDTGVSTFACSAMGNVSSTFGFDRGFDTFVDLYRDPALASAKGTTESQKLFTDGTNGSPVVDPDSGDINDVVIPWIREHANEDFFVLVWSIDTHDPYDPQPEFRNYSQGDGRDTATFADLAGATSPGETEWIQNRYDDLVRQNDHYIGEILDALHEENIYDETVFALTGDHGEAFGELDVYGHSGPPIRALTNVPLVFKLPGGRYAGKTIDSFVELIDLFPTVTRLFDHRSPELVQGEPLPLFDDVSRGENNRTYCYTNLNHILPTYVGVAMNGRRYLKVLPEPPTQAGRHLTDFRDLWRLLKNNLRFWFGSETEYFTDDSNTRAEREHNKHDDLVTRLEEWMDCCIEFHETVQNKQTVTEVDQATTEQLRSMGYID